MYSKLIHSLLEFQFLCLSILNSLYYFQICTFVSDEITFLVLECETMTGTLQQKNSSLFLNTFNLLSCENIPVDITLPYRQLPETRLCNQAFKRAAISLLYVRQRVQLTCVKFLSRNIIDKFCYKRLRCILNV